MIEVILLERVERLGSMGQVVKVRPGFARNFLLPQKKALRATKANIDQFEKQRSEHEAKNNAERSKAETLAGKMEGLTLTVIRQASDTGQLYGSVAARDVADAAKESGQELHRSQVQIDTPIKALGLYPIKIKLHAEVIAKITVNVARSPEEATVQADKSVAEAKKSKEKSEVVAAFGAPEEAEKKKAAAPKKRSKKDSELHEEGEEETKHARAKPDKAKAVKDDDGEDEPKAKKAKAKK